MQADEPRLGPVIEMAAHRVSHPVVKLGHGGGLREDRLADRPRGQASVRSVFHYEDDLIHKRILARLVATRHAATGTSRTPRYLRKCATLPAPWTPCPPPSCKAKSPARFPGRTSRSCPSAATRGG